MIGNRGLQGKSCVPRIGGNDVEIAKYNLSGAGVA